MKKSYPYIDILSFIFVFAVVAIPTFLFNPTNVGSKILKSILICAIPFYFIVLGFLTFKEADLTSRKDVERQFIKSIRKIGKLYLIWTLIYLPISIYFSP